MEMIADEGIEAHRGDGCLRGDRGHFVSRALSLQRLVIEHGLIGTGCRERIGIGTHRANGFSIVIEGAMPKRRAFLVGRAVPSSLRLPDSGKSGARGGLSTLTVRPCYICKARSLSGASKGRQLALRF
jgi:hypothetical protein